MTVDLDFSQAETNWSRIHSQSPPGTPPQRTSASAATPAAGFNMLELFKLGKSLKEQSGAKLAGQVMQILDKGGDLTPVIGNSDIALAASDLLHEWAGKLKERNLPLDLTNEAVIEFLIGELSSGAPLPISAEDLREFVT